MEKNKQQSALAKQRPTKPIIFKSLLAKANGNTIKGPHDLKVMAIVIMLSIKESKRDAVELCA